MQSFIVMQGRTYHEEREVGIIWTPRKDRIGQEQHSWERVREVRAGDRILHYVKGYIVAMSVATSDYVIAEKPSSMRTHLEDNEEGYLVHLEYHELEIPLNVRDHFTHIEPYLPMKYSPFQQDSNGNQGYLYPCNEELLIKLVELIGELNIFVEDDEQLEFAIGIVKRTEHNTFIPMLTETESKAKTKVRLGKQKFRNELMDQWNGTCAICEIKLSALLKASHSKPWKDSTEAERLNRYNGLLLCRNHAALYDEGFIAFDGQGKIHISSQIPEEDYEKYAIHAKVKIVRMEENKYYFKWHKKHMLKK